MGIVSDTILTTHLIVVAHTHIITIVGIRATMIATIQVITILTDTKEFRVFLSRCDGAHRTRLVWCE